MKNRLIILLVFTTYSLCTAQQISHISINSMGGSFQGQEVNVSLTIGELVVERFDGVNISLGGGFYHSVDIITSVDEDNISEDGLKVYPNPTFGELTIAISDRQGCCLKFILFTPDGKLIDAQSTNTNSISLNIEDNSPGIYFLKIQNTVTGTTTHFKVIKK